MMSGGEYSNADIEQRIEDIFEREPWLGQPQLLVHLCARAYPDLARAHEDLPPVYVRLFAIDRAEASGKVASLADVSVGRSKLVRETVTFSNKRKRPADLISTDFHLYGGRPVTWADVHGATRVRLEMRDFFSALRYPALWVGPARPRRTLLLTGPPGTGKTSAVRAIMHEARELRLEPPVTFFEMSGSDVSSSDWGAAARAVKELVAFAAEKAPSIIFVDECDGVFRGDGRLVSELKIILTNMEKGSDNILLIGATNHVEKIDTAIRSKLGDPIELQLPSREIRREIMKTAVRRSPFDFELADSEWEKVLDATEGKDGRWLAETTLVPKVTKIVAREATLAREASSSHSLARQPPRKVTFADFQQALSQIAADETSAAGDTAASSSSVPPNTQMGSALVPSTNVAATSGAPAAEPSGREIRVAAARRLFSLADGSPIKFRHEVYTHLAEHEPDAWASFGSECKRKEATTRPTRGKVAHPLIVGEWNWVLHDAFGFKAFTHDVGRNQHDASLPSGFYTTQLAFKPSLVAATEGLGESSSDDEEDEDESSDDDASSSNSLDHEGGDAMVPDVSEQAEYDETEDARECGDKKGKEKKPARRGAAGSNEQSPSNAASNEQSPSLRRSQR